MAKLFQTLFRSSGRKPSTEVSRYNLDWYIQQLNNPYALYASGGTTLRNGRTVEEAEHAFTGYVQAAYKANGPIFGIVLARLMLFTEARLAYRRLVNGRPGDLFGDDEGGSLSLLQKPWPNGTTGELLARMEQDASFSGNSFTVNEGDRLRRLRPDWVSIVLSGDPDQEFDVDVLGYAYTPGGLGRGETKVYLPDEVCHWSPIPDPLSQYRGMSWLTPVIRELQADQAATDHKSAFFKNGASPRLVVSLKESVREEQFKKFVRAMAESTGGTDQAYKTMYLAGGADVTVAGADLRQLDFRATQGAGEPLALDTPIPTPTGWTTMGEIQVGDQVIGRDGKPANVLGVSPIHTDRVCYRLTLKDRTSIVADASHLWIAVDRGSARRAEKVYTTQELYDLHVKPYSNGVGGHRLSLPATPVVELPAVDLLVDPYVLGAWLGDGQTAGAAICGADEDLAYICKEIESRGYVTSRWNVSEDKVAVAGLPGGLLHALKALGTLGNKHIPADYLRGSVEQRLDLLRGLMDTDGTVDRAGKGGCEFSSKDEYLARQVAELVRSLGYRATLSRKVAVRSRTGETWRVYFRGEADRNPFLLPRKVERVIAAGRPNIGDYRAIVSIEQVESVPVRCIAVDTEDHLFLAGDGLVPTHNTRLCAAGGVPPIIVGLSEGLQAATYSNYASARRKFGDHWARPQWRSACAALASITDVPDGAELWYDDRGIAFLREDQKDAAEIQATRASTINTYITAGFTPESVVASVDADDLTLLVHSGMMSVQLQPPGGAVPEVDPALAAEPPLDGPATDEDTDALIGAMAELDGASRAWAANLHPRGQGGKFRSTQDKLRDSLSAHKSGGGGADPFEMFSAAQLHKVAEARGVDVKKGAGKKDISAALLDSIHGGANPAGLTGSDGSALHGVKRPAKSAKPAGPEAPEKPEPPAATTPTPAAPAGRGSLSDLVNSPVTGRQSLSPGSVGVVERVSHPDGDEFHKVNQDFGGRSAEESTDAEELASLIGEAMNLPIPRVHRSGPAELHTDWTEGVTGAEYAAEHGDDALAELANSDTGRLLGIFDLIVGNSDRHDGNFMVTDDGQLVGIDHGFTWSRVGGNGQIVDIGSTDEDALDGEDFIRELSDSGGSRFNDHIGQGGVNFLTGEDSGPLEFPFISPGDVGEIRSRLEALRPEFDRLGRGPWLDHSLRVVDALRPFATGTGSILQ